MTAGTAKLAPATVAGYRPARFLDVMHSEWTKARTVPSTLWTLLASAALGIGLGALFSALAANHYASGSVQLRATWDPTAVSGTGLGLAELAIGVLGILLITSEYATKAIATSLTAVPRRGRLLAAKAVVVTAMALVAGEVMALVAFWAGQALISGHAPTASLGQHNVFRAVIGGGLNIALIGLLGVALGTLLRHAAGAISVLVAVLYVLPGIAAALPTSIEHTVEKYWPTQAAQQAATVVPTAHTLAPWPGLGVMVLFVLIVVAAALIRFARSDA